MKDNKDTNIKIELDSFLVTVCKDKSLQPFSNTFHFEGENLAQNKLGEIFGVIKIKDHSEESAYLPNLLSQVVKREFFLKPNRGTEESFESALNKINLALADLAEHDITNWLNNLDAVIGVINEDNFHFTKLGDGQILLSKNNQVINISNGLNEETNVHPVKTFSDISSGTLSIDDKVIFSTKELFKSLSWDEITRHTKTFTSNEFDNILKSTLDLEGQDTGVVIVNVKKKSVMPIKEVKIPKVLNFFGESESFSAKNSLGKRCYSLKNKSPEQENIAIEITQKSSVNVLSSSLIPKKTRGGEIELSQTKKKPTEKVTQVKKATNLNESFPISPFEENPELFIKETDEDDELKIDKVDNETEIKLDSVLNKVRQALEELKKKNNISSNSIPLISKFKLGKEAENIKEMSFKDGVSYPTEPSDEAYQKEELEKEKEKVRKEKESMRFKNETIRKKEEQNFKKMQEEFRSSANKIKLRIKSLNLETWLPQIKIFLIEILAKIKIFYKKTYEKTRSIANANKKKITSFKKNVAHVANVKEETSFEAKHPNKQGKGGKLLAEYFNKILLFLKIKTNFKSKNISKKIKYLLGFGNKYKKFILIGIILIIVLYIAVSFLFKDGVSSEISNSEDQGVSKQQAPLGNHVETTTIANFESEIQSLTGDKDELFIYTTSGKFFRLNITTNELSEIPLKSDVQDIKYLVSMPTLRLIFLVSEKNVFSYSPVVNRLTDIDIRLPENLAIGGAGVYLQYLYILDKNSDNIYQFPRKPGGFNNYKVRIPDQKFFSTASDLAVDDSLLVSAENGEIQQYFEGKLKTSFSAKIEGYDTVKIIDIETGVEPSNIYALDSENGVVFKIPRGDQTKTERLFNQSFVEANHLWINEKQDRAFIATKNGEILRIAL